MRLRELAQPAPDDDEPDLHRIRSLNRSCSTGQQAARGNSPITKYEKKKILNDLG